MAKKKSAAEASGPKGVRVIAVQSYTSKDGESHPYGHEFAHADNAELKALLEKKVLRLDDRMAVPGVPPSKPAAAEEPAP